MVSKLIKNKFVKNILTLFIVLVLIIGNSISINAATFSVWVDKTTVDQIGDIVTLTARISDPYGMIQIKPSVSGELEIIEGVGPNGETAQTSGSDAKVKIKVNGPGTISVGGFAYDTNDKEYPAGQTFSILIKDSSTPEENDKKEDDVSPTPPENNDDGIKIPIPNKDKNEEDDSSDKTLIPDGKEETSTQKTPEQLEEEVIGRTEAELEKKEKFPLISEFNIISNSEKLQDEKITSIPSEIDNFKYTYTLPKRIDQFSLEIKTISNDVTLSYEENQIIHEEEDFVEIPIKANLGDIFQDYVLTVSENKEVPAKIKVGDSYKVVYDDEILDETMTSFGFEKKTFEVDESLVSYFDKGSMSLILILEEDKAVWYTLDDHLKLEDKGVLFLDKDMNALFILDASDPASKQTLYHNSYTDRVISISDSLVKVDSDLSFYDEYKSWEFDESREVVYGLDESGEKDYYALTKDSFKSVLVAFDAVDEGFEIMTWGLGGILFSLLGTSSLFAISKKHKDKIESLPKDSK